MTRTFQLRLPGEQPELDRMASVYQTMVRTLYTEAWKQDASVESFKQNFCQRFGVPARIFNAAATDVKAMIASAREKAKVDAEDLKDKLAQADRKIARLRKIRADRGGLTNRQRSQLVGQYRRRDILAGRLARAERVAAQKWPALCFGGRRLFKAQHHPEAHGYRSTKTFHRDWVRRWRAARSDEFLVVGSSDEVAGNKTCRAVLAEDGSVDLRLAGIDGGTVAFEGLTLPHGHEVWTQAIADATEEARTSRDYQTETRRLIAEHKRTLTWPAATVAKALREGITCEQAFRRQRMGQRKGQAKRGSAITYRFKRDGYSWRVFITVHQPTPQVAADYSNGAIGADMNADHLAVASVTADGDLESIARIDTHVANKSTGQRLDIYRQAAKKIVDRAEAEGRPIVIEALDFRAKRRRLREVGSARQARMLSAFATQMFYSALMSRARRRGVAVVDVDPAFTSVIGATRAKTFGVSVHQAAAWAIARRGLGVREYVPYRFAVPDGHRKPLTVSSSADLQSKARSDEREVWRETAARIKAARQERPRLSSGSQRRHRRRVERELTADRTFLHAMRSAAPGETPGGTFTRRDVEVAPAVGV